MIQNNKMIQNNMYKLAGLLKVEAKYNLHHIA